MMQHVLSRAVASLIAPVYVRMRDSFDSVSFIWDSFGIKMRATLWDTAAICQLCARTARRCVLFVVALRLLRSARMS